MTTTYTDAPDEIFALYKAAVDTNGPLIVGYVPETVYQGVDKGEKTPLDKFWQMAQVQTVDEEQTTFRSSSAKRYTTYGFALFQLFAPRNDAESWLKLKEFAKAIRNGFRGKTTPGHIVFRNARCQELTPEDTFHRINVVVEFEYDEIS